MKKPINAPDVAVFASASWAANGGVPEGMRRMTDALLKGRRDQKLQPAQNASFAVLLDAMKQITAIYGGKVPDGHARFLAELFESGITGASPS